MSDKDNIIPFPSLKVSNLSKQRLKAEQLTEEMKKTKAFDLCNHLSEAVMMAGAKELALNGFKVQDPEFYEASVSAHTDEEYVNLNFTMRHIDRKLVFSKLNDIKDKMKLLTASDALVNLCKE